jgi:uncharacterized membrane protein YsdA (DUF1294 family)/cold shock CspA family protein
MSSLSQSPPTPKVGSTFTSKIIEWDDSKGFGFLLHQERKLFLHRKDFAERHKRPGKGDRIHYQLGTDHKGRKCAVEAMHVNDGGKLTIFTWINLVLLLLIPLLALNKATVVNDIPLLYVAGAFGLLIFFNIVTYGAYAGDKQQAQAKEWRTPESSLHILEAIGGWPAAFIAQRKLRHKTSKGEFQLVYWFIVISHILIALDYIRGWKILTALLQSN